MPTTEWSDIFGPALPQQSSASAVKDLDATTKQFRSISERALNLCSKLLGSHTVRLEQSALFSALPKEIAEAMVAACKKPSNFSFFCFHCFLFIPFFLLFRASFYLQIYQFWSFFFCVIFLFFSSCLSFSLFLVLFFSILFCSFFIFLASF